MPAIRRICASDRLSRRAPISATAAAASARPGVIFPPYAAQSAPRSDLRLCENSALTADTVPAVRTAFLRSSTISESTLGSGVNCPLPTAATRRTSKAHLAITVTALRCRRGPPPAILSANSLWTMTTARGTGDLESHSIARRLCEYGRLETNTDAVQRSGSPANPSPCTMHRLALPDSRALASSKNAASASYETTLPAASHSGPVSAPAPEPTSTTESSLPGRAVATMRAAAGAPSLRRCWPSRRRRRRLGPIPRPILGPGSPVAVAAAADPAPPAAAVWVTSWRTGTCGSCR